MELMAGNIFEQFCLISSVVLGKCFVEVETVVQSERLLFQLFITQKKNGTFLNTGSYLIILSKTPPAESGNTNWGGGSPLGGGP